MNGTLSYRAFAALAHAHNVIYSYNFAHDMAMSMSVNLESVNNSRSVRVVRKCKVKCSVLVYIILT